MSRCVRCNSSRTVEGKGWQRDAQDDFVLGGFSPPIKWWKLLSRTTTRFRYPLVACIECGLVWTEVDHGELKDVLVVGGTDDIKQSLGLSGSSSSRPPKS